MDFGDFRLYNPCCYLLDRYNIIIIGQKFGEGGENLKDTNIFYIQILWYRLANFHPSTADALVEAVMSADHHLEQMASLLVTVSLTEGVLQAE